MPFGICSVPEVWQRTMHEFVQDLEEVEVIADDFLISGFGRSDHEVNNSLQRHAHAFLQKMPPVEPQAKSCQSERAPVKCEVHGSPSHFSGPKA